MRFRFCCCFLLLSLAFHTMPCFLELKLEYDERHPCFALPFLLCSAKVAFKHVLQSFLKALAMMVSGATCFFLCSICLSVFLVLAEEDITSAMPSASEASSALLTRVTVPYPATSLSSSSLEQIALLWLLLALCNLIQWRWVIVPILAVYFRVYAYFFTIPSGTSPSDLPLPLLLLDRFSNFLQTQVRMQSITVALLLKAACAVLGMISVFVSFPPDGGFFVLAITTASLGTFILATMAHNFFLLDSTHAAFHAASKAAAPAVGLKVSALAVLNNPNTMLALVPLIMIGTSFPALFLS